MAFDIGQVVSPAVAAALIRRGENANSYSGIKRDPTIRRETTQGVTPQDAMAVARENRAAELQKAQLEAQTRGEAFSREQFQYGQEKDKADREAGIKRTDATAALAQSKAVGDARQQVSKTIGDIQKIMAGARKVDPNTGRVDPVAVAQAQRAAAALWQQIANSGLPPEEISALRDSITAANGTSTPASRAPGGVDRGGTGAPQAAMSQAQMQQAGKEWGDIVHLSYSARSGKMTPEQFASAAQQKLAGILALPLTPEQKQGITEKYQQILRSLGGGSVSRPAPAESPQAAPTGAPKVEAGLANELSRVVRTP